MTESASIDAVLPPVPTGTHPWVAQWRDRVGFGVSIFPQPPDWQRFMRLVQRMEAMGVDSYWSYDHPAANADCWTALAALAVSTEKIRLGTMVDCIYYRSAYLLARQAADVDRASGNPPAPGVAHAAFHRVLGGIAIATHELHGIAGDRTCNLVGEAFGR